MTPDNETVLEPEPVDLPPPTPGWQWEFVGVIEVSAQNLFDRSEVVD